MKSLYMGTMRASPNSSANAASQRCSGRRSLNQSTTSNFGESAASGPFSLDPSFLCEFSGVKTGRLGVGCFRFPIQQIAPQFDFDRSRIKKADPSGCSDAQTHLIRHLARLIEEDLEISS